MQNHNSSPSDKTLPADVSVIDRLHDFAKQFDERLHKFLGSRDGVPDQLREAMVYSALAPGKRIRPYLVMRCCELVGGQRDDCWPAAAALECVHAFSLIHDDLPAMDDDDLRRGQPTCHKKFGEATAILAGDALVVRAFELLAVHIENPMLSGEMIRALAQTTGWYGMIGGQAADLLGEDEEASLDLVKYIHARKTGALFSASCHLGALAGGANVAQIEGLREYGQRLGEAFQIADDLLDVTSTESALGKGVGKDTQAGKQTYPRCVGTEKSRSAAILACDACIAQLAIFGAKAEDLRAIADYVVARNY